MRNRKSVQSLELTDMGFDMAVLSAAISCLRTVIWGLEQGLRQAAHRFTHSQNVWERRIVTRPLPRQKWL
jgi:hypothetical protein